MIPTLTLKTGNKIPKLGFGTWMIGGDKNRNPKNDDVGQINSIKYAINSGITWLRTAQNYAEGHCEEIIAKAIQGTPRENLYIMVAVNQKFIKKEDDFIREAKVSLNRLGIEYVDLYMVGGLDETISLKTIANGLKRVKNEGLAKDIGVGNYRLPELRQIHEYLGDDLVYNEVHANLLIREPFENGVYQYCRDNNIVMGAYRPLQLGQLSKSGINILDALSTKYSKSQSEIALKWLLSFQGVITMPKALKSEHIDQLSKINDWTISKDDITELTKNFPLQVSVSDCTLPISKYIK